MTKIAFPKVVAAVIVALLGGCAIVPYGPPVPVAIGVHADGYHGRGYYDRGYYDRGYEGRGYYGRGGRY